MLNLKDPANRDRDRALATDGGEHRLRPGVLEVVSPTLCDIHRVRIAITDKVSVSIHMYGANIGEVERHAQ